LNHTDLTVGLGGTDTAKGVCYKQLAYDAYTWELCREFGKRAEISEETIALDLVREVGHGHEFLTHKHTSKHFRRELTLWDEKIHALLTTDDFEALSDKLYGVVTETLSTHRVPELENAVVERGNEMIRAYQERHRS
jgi:trimethylamine--corrinoid protein Co-methyltransferase